MLIMSDVRVRFSLSFGGHCFPVELKHEFTGHSAKGELVSNLSITK